MSKDLPVVLLIDEDKQYHPLLEQALDTYAKTLAGRNYEEALGHMLVGIGTAVAGRDRIIQVIVIGSSVQCAVRKDAAEFVRRTADRFSDLTLARTARSLGFTGVIICASGDPAVRAEMLAAGCELIDSYRPFGDLRPLAATVLKRLTATSLSSRP